MAGLKAGGIGSGLDINSLVSQLVAAERAPQAQRLNRAESGAKFKLTAIARLTSSFDALKTSLDTFKASATYGKRSVVSSSSEHFTGTATAGVPLGSYQVQVMALASASKQISAGVDADAGLPAGTLNVSVGEVDFVVEVGDATTPDGLRRAFNEAAAAAGARVNATLVTGDDGLARLSVTGQDTGAANAVVITSDAPGLAAFTSEHMDSLSTAGDARVRIDGVERSSSSNVVDGAIDGLAITLKKVSEEPGSLNLTSDNAPTRSALQAFVTAYNTAIKTLAETSRFDANSGEAGALNGDALTRGATRDLRNAFSAFVGEGSALGLSTQLDGTLKFDTARFEATVSQDPTRVESTLRAFGESLGGTISRYVGSDGVLKSRKDSLDSRVKQATTQREQLDRRMEAVEARLLRQFTALDSLIAQLNNTSSYLGQQLSNLPGFTRPD